MRRQFALIILCVYLLLLCGCSKQPGELKNEPSASPPQTQEEIKEDPVVEDVVQQLLDTLSREEKVGQLFVVRPEALNGVSELTDAMQLALAEYPVCGIAMFSQNILSPQQIIDFNNELQGALKIPMFLAVDEEGGLVARLANSSTFDLPKFKNGFTVGSSGNPEDAFVMGKAIGAYLKEYGFNMNFAPVADVNTNPQNPVIGNRAFSSDPVIASQMAHAMADGLNDQGIIAVFKHFPGHGDTAQDSHFGLATIQKNIDALNNCELIPFSNLESTDCIMVGHISLPEVTKSNIPATFSREIVTELLINEMGFDGLVITDSMEMGAVTAQYGSGEAAVLALEAGCDIVLMPLNLKEAFTAVMDALNEGRLTDQWLNETVYKILSFKKSQGVLQ